MTSHGVEERTHTLNEAPTRFGAKLPIRRPRLLHAMPVGDTLMRLLWAS